MSNGEKEEEGNGWKECTNPSEVMRYSTIVVCMLQIRAEEYGDMVVNKKPPPTLSNRLVSTFNTYALNVSSAVVIWMSYCSPLLTMDKEVRSSEERRTRYK